MSDGNENWAIALEQTLRGYEKHRPGWIPSPSDVVTDVRAALANLEENLYLPPAPADGKHQFEINAFSNIYPSCKFCGISENGVTNALACPGRYENSSAMRQWADDRWKGDLRRNRYITGQSLRSDY